MNDTKTLLFITIFHFNFQITHHLQYPENTTHVYSYFESRGGKFQSTVFFGLQYILKRWLVGNVLTEEQINEASALMKLHFGKDVFNEEGWRYILKVDNLSFCCQLTCTTNLT